LWCIPAGRWRIKLQRSVLGKAFCYRVAVDITLAGCWQHCTLYRLRPLAPVSVLELEGVAVIRGASAHRAYEPSGNVLIRGVCYEQPLVAGNDASGDNRDTALLGCFPPDWLHKPDPVDADCASGDRKSTRLNSSHRL